MILLLFILWIKFQSATTEIKDVALRLSKDKIINLDHPNGRSWATCLCDAVCNPDLLYYFVFYSWTSIKLSPSGKWPLKRSQVYSKYGERFNSGDLLSDHLIEGDRLIRCCLIQVRLYLGGWLVKLLCNVLLIFFAGWKNRRGFRKRVKVS